MTPEQQRIAIAEARGWTEIFRYENDYLTGTRPRQTMEDAAQIKMAVPYYLNDLNAMHEAEKVLTTKELRFRYFAYIKQQMSDCAYATTDSHVLPIIATASQRAEAFLRTIGKWLD